MNKKQEEFLARLRETFRIEAAEHLDAITSGLVAMESASAADRAPIVERIFREAHSLKGAARSVSLTSVEVLCQEIESVFADLKSGEMNASTELLDSIHPVLDVVGVLCANPGAEPAPDIVEKEKTTFEKLKMHSRGQYVPLKDTRTDTGERQSGVVTVAPEPYLPPAPSETAISDECQSMGVSGTAQAPEEPTVNIPAASETIRVSTAKLSAILLEIEELMSVKIAEYGHVAELARIADDFGKRIRHRGLEGIQHRSRQGGSSDSEESIESEMLYGRAIEKSLRDLAKSMHQNAHTLGSLGDTLLEDAKKVLMLPCSYLLNAFPKLARDLARDHDKVADLVIRGEDIEIDRRVLDEIKVPLIHILRNCIDHGIEKPDTRREHGKPGRGVVAITVTQVQGNRVEITVSDDGAGIDPVRVGKSSINLGFITAGEAAHMNSEDINSLIFHSGLTTSPIITDLSGRGLGLAIVREKVEKLGGTIQVESSPGTGATFRMLVPLSLATFRGVFVETAGNRFVFPTSNVVRVARVTAEEIKTVENRQTIAVNGRALSLVRLRDVLGLSGPEGRTGGAARPVVIVNAAEREIAFMVDEVLGEQEVMIKNLGRQLARVRNIMGASITGSGAVVPILNTLDLVESASNSGYTEISGDVPVSVQERRGRLLIAEDSITARTLVKAILEGAGYEVVATVDGMDALTTLKTESFDLVVSDVDMPRMNGFDLTSRIRADRNLENLPVVLVTALGSRKDREYGIEVGANAYIVKSDFDQSNLLEIIDRLL